jgi:hypothetical protein
LRGDRGDQAAEEVAATTSSVVPKYERGPRTRMRVAQRTLARAKSILP